MNGVALALVLSGAVCHATWNVVAKRASGGADFVFLYGVVSVFVSAPIAAWVWRQAPQSFDGSMWLAVLLSAGLHVLYSLVLQHAYRVSEFVVVYPVARGSGPMFAVLAAIVLLGERPSMIGWTAVAAILMGVVVSAGGVRLMAGGGEAARRRGVVWGVTTGLLIAAYSVLDGWAVKTLGMSPVLFYASGLVCRVLLQLPFALWRTPSLRLQWAKHRMAIGVVGVLSPAAYCLILLALQQAPLSYVAPLREVSMLVGTFIGASFLKERIRAHQVFGAVLMLSGVLGLMGA